MPTTDASSRMSEATESLRRDIDDLKGDLHDIQADLRGLVRDLLGAGRVSASDATQRLSSAVGESVRLTREHGRHLAEVVEDQIRERPYVSCGVALAIGLALGSALSHRR